jgi:2-oxopent-4-enoate/cis-2-oxohex-4-enoate hydratase
VDSTKTDAYGDELYQALRTRKAVAPLTSREPDITLDDSYRISRRMLERRLADGEKLIGKKIGVTSKPVQRMLDVHQPDFGWLTDRMKIDEGGEMPISTTLIQPRAEGELAFVLKRDLVGPGVTMDDVLAATDCVMPCFEIVDSRIENWKIRIQDTVADNASSGMFVVGREPVSPSKVDFYTCGMVVEKNGEIISTGAGAAALGSPVYCVAWLANTMGAFGIPLKAGEIILSGSLVPLEPIVPGDRMKVTIGGVGIATVSFT